MKKLILTTLVSVVLLLNVFCLTALAADIQGTVSVDRAANEVIVEVTGLEAGSEVSLLGFINGNDLFADDVDYINQYTADGDGFLSVIYPSATDPADWALGDIITVKVNGVDLIGEVPYPTWAIIDGPSVVVVKLNAVGNLTSISDVPQATASSWISSNGNVGIRGTGNEATFVAAKVGVSVITVTYPSAPDSDPVIAKVTVKVNP